MSVLQRKPIYAIVLQLKRRNTFISPWEARRWLRVAAASAAELLGPAETAVCMRRCKIGVLCWGLGVRGAPHLVVA